MEPLTMNKTQNTNRMNLKNILAGLPALLLLCTACNGNTTTKDDHKPEPVRLVEIDTTVLGLVIYYPPTDSIELRCFDRPDPESDSSIVFCCAAAFTADFATEANHDRICGDHVSGGQYYKRPRLKRNTGAFFVGEDGRYAFMYSPDAKQETFRLEFEHAQAGFTQEMMLRRGERVKTTRPDGNVNQFRALCLTTGDRLCVADAEGPMQFGQFIQLLQQAGMYDALYMDMGPGWNYSWYREYADSAETYIHSWPISSATNWLVFYRK